MTHREQHAIVTAVQDWLSQGMLTPLQGLERVHALRQAGQDDLASVMQTAIQTWHDAEMEHTRDMMAHGI
jgi:hypothetical protein